MNIVDLQIHPRKSISWEEFLQSTPPLSIALDGYVSAPPQYDSATKHLNLDHHHDVFRQSTMSTAQQVMMAVKGGLFTSFRKKIDGIERPYVRVYVNDCDQDVVLAIFILEHYKLFEGTNSIPMFNRLLEIDGKFDITAGAYPMNLGEDLFQQHEWVFEPYNNLRTSGKLGNATSQMLFDNIEATMSRLMQFIMGNAGKVEVRLKFNTLESPEHKSFMSLDETSLGLHSRYYAFSQGMKAYISLVSQSDAGNVYTVGRSSVFIDFDVPFLLDLLDRVEGLNLEMGKFNPNESTLIQFRKESLKRIIPSLNWLQEQPRQNKWGGSDLMGGSRSSSIPPFVITLIVDRLLDLLEEE